LTKTANRIPGLLHETGNVNGFYRLQAVSRLQGFRFQVVTIPTAICNINHSPSGDLNWMRCAPRRYGFGSGSKIRRLMLEQMTAAAHKENEKKPRMWFTRRHIVGGSFLALPPASARQSASRKKLFARSDDAPPAAVRAIKSMSP
jgi:hypothetical protein